MSISVDRLWSDLQSLAAFGRDAAGGITRPALGEADRGARNWLRDRMESAGLTVTVDPAANVIGRLPCADPGAPVVVIGSHLDTVPGGGMFDGALGVLGGIECVRSLIADGTSLPWHLEVINFTDEEGHHNAGTFGSRAMMGLLEAGEVDRSRSGGPTMAGSLRSLGLDPARVSDARRDPGEFRAYFELHIEQGGRLETGGVDIGIVTGIVGIYRYAVTIGGVANHAGTTPMDERRDALVAAAPLFSLLPRWARERTSDMVATIGQVSVEPGAMNVIPGKCLCIVELRALDSSHMRHVRDLVVGFSRDIPGSTVDAILEKDGENLHGGLMDISEKAARSLDLTTVRLASGAGHDAQSFAPHVPTGMLFVPSRGGLSHCPEEWTDPPKAADGVRALRETLLELRALDREGADER